MGLFNKLKQDLNHGGIKLKIGSPESIQANQPITVAINVTAENAQTINSVTVSLQAQARESGIGMGSMDGLGQPMNNGGMNMQQQETNYQTIAQAENREPFTVSPGETKTVNVQLVLSGNSGQSSNVGGITGSVLNALSGLEHVNYLYRIHVSADVEGVGIGPSDNQSVQVLPANPSIMS